ncbi:tail tube protein [Rhizobium phage RHph_Y52]|nr:tail tube protein [Rhizobium phage RHph_Y60]QIG73358.1 tail tube protein [Rhizobium phage RHph_Y5A]QIG75281.1 tail tube protein [Rhizobium phage RHph_Y21]QIG75492.1 tail tube protein [Rhizobium phage RHph_Y2_4]QIG76753.1 tail tube protein [Rhizobium phage RHph_Y52]
MSVNTAAGSAVYIAPQTPSFVTLIDNPASTDSAIITAAEALTWTEVGETEDLGEFGDEASEITFTALSNRRVRKFKGTYNAGTITCTVGSDPADAGQQAMIAAFASDLDYPFKVTLNDKITLAGTPTTLYFTGKVMSKRRNIGNVENVVRQNFPIGINSKIVEDPAT